MQGPPARGFVSIIIIFFSLRLTGPDRGQYDKKNDRRRAGEEEQV